MFSPVLFRFSKLNSCLALLFFLSSFHQLSCVVSQQEHSLCDNLFHCGDIIAGFPFWGGSRPETCGHPSLGLHCGENTTTLIISGQMYQILQIDNSSNTLRLARQDFIVQAFCDATFTGTTLTPELFELLPDYKILFVNYLCNHRLHNPANFSCPKLGVASVDRKNQNDGICGASFNITVPQSYDPEEAFNVTHLESALKEGFKVKLKIEETPCQDCQYSGGICAYHDATQVCCKTNSSYESTCTPVTPLASSVISNKGKLGMGFVCGFVGATLIVVLCFIILRRKKLAAQYTSKDLSTSSPYSSNTMPMTPPSTTISNSNHSLVPSISGLANGSGYFRGRETSHYPRDLKSLLLLKPYSYAEVKKITKSFAHRVGEGGFGTVYAGNLYDGRKVAVKILRDFKSNGEDFINEVASMSQTSHVNIVSLLGFCYEGSKRAIVYEFLENGSLDQFISKKKPLDLDVPTLYGIAVGVARGLEYLHHGCRTRIIHFDIKPQNVLLDDNLCPRVSDFGLAKLCEKRESILSLLDTRGTIGYIAPEVFSRMYGRVSHKSDVYSYGMLVLEMIGARNKETVETSASNAKSAYFPDWIYEDLENGEHTWRFGDDITKEEKDIVKKMTLVGLSCIQPCPSNRPSMNRVVEMMEGSLDSLEVPPKPSLHSKVPLLQSSSLSEENSNYS